MTIPTLKEMAMHRNESVKLPDQLFTTSAEGVRLYLKIVPGASRTKVAGLLGSRLKLLVSAAPQAGKANKMVCQLLAKTFGLSSRDISIVAGQTQAFKTALLANRSNEQVETILRNILL